MSGRRASKPILVTGATGTTGREVVRALLGRGAPVRVLIRSREKVENLSRSVEPAIGDLEDGPSVARALDGVSAAFFVPPHDEAEAEFTRIFVDACERTGVRLVFSGVHTDGPTRLIRWVRRGLNGLLFPHYSDKMRLSEHVRMSPTRPVLLLPGNFYQNDELSRDHLLNGRFPLPFKAFPRVDAQDVGDAAANALLDSSVKSGVYWLVGQASMKGEEIAANWGAALMREVRYMPDLNVSKQIFDRCLPPKKAHDYLKTQELIARFPLPIKAADRLKGETLLGRPPRPHADYARETAERWRAEGLMARNDCRAPELREIP